MWMLQKSKNNYDACIGKHYHSFNGTEKKKVTSQIQRKMPTSGFYKEKRTIIMTLQTLLHLIT